MLLSNIKSKVEGFFQILCPSQNVQTNPIVNKWRLTFFYCLCLNVLNFDEYCFSGALIKLKSDFEEFPNLQLASKKTITYVFTN